ncbi:Membrane metallo-endopeptidase-like 1 [Folsomia candida]|uniref:Membrane metallo-endopeptidase-like 1 n=1 Tax=Folsomia candida TaxID=158441 RepID=A0A226EMH1_FOLCA|nr:Membrane metallo-endopeptidase-like 1 [Folsomia candida]
MGSKAILENKSSLSNLISPVSPPTSACSSSDFSGFHLPPATTRIYPYSNFVGKNNTKFKQRRNRNGNNSSQHGLLSAFFWFALGTFISVLVIFIATQTLVLDLTSSSTKKHLCEQQPQGQEDNNLTDSASNGDKCFRVECLKAASRIMHRMDQTQQPCDDFYQFSCGRFIAHNEIPDDSFQRSTLQEMQESILVDIKKLIDQPGSANENIAIQKARQLYTSCMHNSFRTSHFTDYKHLPIYQVLNADGIGFWPILEGSNWNKSEYSLERLLAQLISHQVQSIFEIYVTPDDVDSSQYLLQFYKGEPAMEKAFFLNSTNPDYMKYFRSYKRLLLESILILSQGSPTVSSDVDAILDFETKFAKLSQDSRCHFDGFNLDSTEDETNGRITIAEMKAKVQNIDWRLLVQNTFDVLNIERNVTDEMYVYFHCTEFFPKLVALVNQTDSRTVTNYLVWRFVFRYMPFLGNKFLQIWSEFMKDVPDTNEEKLYLSRWKYCANIVNDGFGLTVAYLYVQENYKKSTEMKIKEMISYLKRAFEKIIVEQAWLDSRFKQDVIDKLQNMGSKIGIPSFILEEKALEHEYEGLDFNETYFLMNILKLRRYEVSKEIRKVNRPVDKDRDWLVQPMVANAFHNPTANEIVIPLGILRYPMFEENYPMYLNFANLGIVISHEITHGFDHQGRHYDRDGNFTSSWWPDEVISAFKTQAICFADQYAKFEMPMVNTNVDGNETLADNVCDNSALRVAFLAYQLWVQDHGVEPSLPGVNFTIPQIFYISYGQVSTQLICK